MESVDFGMSSTDFGEEGSLTAAELSPSSSSFEHDMSSQEKSGHIGSTDNDLESRASQSSSARIPVYPELDCDNHQEVQHKTNVDRKFGEVESENLFTEPWSERCDIAFPCASQNELNHDDALNLVNSGCQILTEGSNMPCTAEAVDVLRKSKVLVGPA